MKHVTGILRKLGVEKQNLYRERDFVGYALTGAMSAAEKFQILNPVVVADAVDVMDGFLGREFSADVARHDEPMLHDAVLFAGDKARNADPDISIALDVSPVISSFESRKSGGSLVIGLALLTAETLFRVVFDAANRVVFGSRRFLTTLLAVENLSILRVLSPLSVGAGSAAVSRVLSVFLTVLVQKSRLHFERISAVLAGKFDRLDAPSVTPVNGFERLHAIFAAVKGGIELLVVRSKFGSAVFARFRSLSFNGHNGSCVSTGSIFVAPAKLVA